MRNVRIELSRGPDDVRHGLQSVRLINDDPAEWGALAQEGKYLRKGETYSFRGLLRTDGKPVDAEIRFYPRGQWRNPIAVSKLANIGAKFSLKTATFRNDDFEGYATFSLWIPPGASIVADDFSLLSRSPISTAGAKTWSERSRRSSQSCFDFRAAVSLPSTTGATVLDPLAERPPDASYFWGGMNYNELGTDEFAAMCKRVGAEMMFAVNLYPPRQEGLPAHHAERTSRQQHAFLRHVALHGPGEGRAGSRGLGGLLQPARRAAIPWPICARRTATGSPGA